MFFWLRVFFFSTFLHFYIHSKVIPFLASAHFLPVNYREFLCHCGYGEKKKTTLLETASTWLCVWQNNSRCHMTNRKCKLSSVSLTFWHTFRFQYIIRVYLHIVSYVRLDTLWASLLLLHLYLWSVSVFLSTEFLKIRRFLRNENPKNVDWRLWYLNFILRPSPTYI